MAISLDSFKQTVSSTHMEGFIKLSADGASVKSYGDGFFARHFGHYSKPSVAENNAVRREFYESVVNTYHCQGAVLDALRSALCIGADGSSTSGKQLSVRDAMTVLQCVQADADMKVAARKKILDPLVDGALRQLSNDIGIDCSSMKDSIISKLDSAVQAQYKGTMDIDQVPKDQLQRDFSTALARLIADKQAMNASLVAATSRLPAAAVSFLRTALASNADFSSPAQMQAMIDHHDAGVPLFKLLYADSVSEQACLDALLTMTAKSDGLDTQTQGMLLDMGKAVAEAQEGRPVPAGNRLKPLLEASTRQLSHVRAQLDDPDNGYLATEKAIHRLEADIANIATFASRCGIPNVGGKRSAKVTISPATQRHLESCGITRPHTDIVNGQHFNASFSSVFQEAFIAFYQDALNRADDAAHFPDIPTAFTQPLADYARTGTGLKVGDTVVSRLLDSVPEGSHARRSFFQESFSKLERFFAEDTTNGLRAARVIGDLAHQGISAAIMVSLQASNELGEIALNQDVNHGIDFSVRRSAAGSYKIHFSGTFNYRGIMEDSQITVLDATKSRVQYDMDLTLSFDTASGKPTIEFDHPPTMSGNLSPLRDIPPTENDMIKDIDLALTHGNGGDARYLHLSGALSDPAVREAMFEKKDLATATALVRSRMLTWDDSELLRLIGFDTDLVSHMLMRNAVDDTPKFGKEIIARLKDPATRDSAMRDLAGFAAPIAQAGWIDHVPAVRPEIINLVTVADLSLDSLGNGFSDALVVADYIGKSQDPDVQRIPVDLQSTNPSVVATAKARAQALVVAARRELGLEVLKHHIDWHTSDSELVAKHIESERYQPLLEHIVTRDDQLEASLNEFKKLLAEANEKNLAEINASRQ